MHGTIAGPRIRAARGYAGITNEELAERCGIGAAKLRGLTQREPRGEIGLEELYRIAQATEVPAAFMEHGFAPLIGAMTSVEQQLSEMRAMVLELMERVQRDSALLAELRDSAGGSGLARPA